jgi:pimeloyl-ACP methyl ester carboxylesterase
MGPMPTSAPLGYAVAECGFQVPEGATAECGRLTVPQVRARPDAGTVTLPVAIFRAPAGGRQPDAVIYLDGGPGGNTLENASALYEVFKPFVANRDLILFDQRGTGGSDPSLDCPEIDQLNYDLLEQQFSVDERVAQDGETTSECHGRLLSDGINPAYATSVENAADVNDLRAALGYAQWNLLGISYGTKLALTVMRDYPGGVRSAILDSTYPPNVDAYAEFGSDFSRALNQMFDSCAGDPVCGGAFPDLRQAYDDVVRTLNERPANVAIGSLTGRPIEGAVIDGLWFSAFVFQSL